MNGDKKPTIDERLEAIIQTLELMVHDTQEAKARMDRLDARERKAREALLAGVSAYLQALRGIDDE